MRYIPWHALLPVVLAAVSARSQEGQIRRISGAVTYVTPTSVYVNAGSKNGLAVGDTLTVEHKGALRGLVSVVAISSSSVMTSIVSRVDTIALGDSAYVVKAVELEKVEPVRGLAANGEATASHANVAHGSVGMQYVGAGAPHSKFDYSQPAALVRLKVTGLFGTGAVLTVNGRAYYDLSGIYNLYGEGSRAKIRMYEATISYDDPRAWYGYSVGRVASRYVTGLGPFDGGQFLVRNDDLLAGVLLGTQPDFRTSGFVTDEQKAAAFVHYTFGKDVFNATDVTVAYGQQLYQGKLDRDFMYVQSSARLGSQMSLYQSSELDLHKIHDGVRTGTFRLTNTFISLAYSPVAWLNTNLGYDATRNIYLFESMKSFPDTLLDQNLQQGFRGSAMVMVLNGVALSVNGNYRMKEGGLPSSNTVGGGLRWSDILESQVNAGARYASIRGIYTRGDDISADVGRWFSPAFSLGFRYDRYAYTVLTTTDRLVTTTASMDVNVSFLGSWYSLLSFDQVWDTVRNSVRIYYEIGIHF